MICYNLKIEILSDTIFAISGGGATVDSITAHYHNGLPYIPAKTIKGLLKESAIEIQEIMGKNWNIDDRNDPINILFGKEGSGNNGNLNFLNGDIENKDFLENEIENNNLSSQEVLNFFTHIRNQTAMKNGVAMEGSLRTLQVLKPGLVFNIPIQLTDPSNYTLLKYACLNLRRVGTNRNRGFGNIKCTIYETTASSELNSLSGNKFIIKLMTPALLPNSGADSNTVSSDKIISGRKILGMLASAYIKENKLMKAHEDVTFKRIFLSGSVIFSDAYPLRSGKATFPLGLHWVHNKEVSEVETDFNPNKREINWKPIGGMYSLDGDKKSKVATVLDFHNSRNKVNQNIDGDYHSRIKGSNQGDGIYYYESLQTGQEFAFMVEGEDEDLTIIRKLLKNRNTLRIGKSSSTALGRISISDFNGTLFKKVSESEEDLVITFISPVILRNDKGEFIPSLRDLSSALGQNLNIKPENARIRTVKIQVYQSSIRMQFPEMIAIAPGSSVRVSKDEYSRIQHKSIGEFTHEGYGKYIVEALHSKEKAENLLNNMNAKNDDRYFNNESHEIIDLQGIGESPLVKSVMIQREISKANAVAKGTSLHKNTTMLMIDFMKDVKLIAKDDFKKACLEVANNYVEKDRFSYKVIATLQDLLHLGSTDFIESRKKNQAQFKTDFSKSLAEALCSHDGIQEFKSVEAKVAYLTKYFNNCKIMNRG